MLEARIAPSEFYRAGWALTLLFIATPEGKCRLKPIVEINPRYTMGRVTVELMKHVAPGSRGLFRLVNHSMLRAEGFEDFAAYARALNERLPPWHLKVSLFEKYAKAHSA